MLKQITTGLLAASLFVASCSKSDSGPQLDKNYTVNGIHDVTLGSGGSYLPLEVTLKADGEQENVKLVMSGLPAGMEAKIEPANGIPSFSSALTLSKTATIAAGTYAVQLVGTSASGVRTYDFNITVPAFNGFTFDGNQYIMDNFLRSTSATFPYVAVYSNLGGGNYVYVVFKDGFFPTASGNYKVVGPDDRDDNDEVAIYVVGGFGNYTSTGTDNKMASINLVNNKFTVTTPEVEVTMVGSTATKKVSVTATEQ